MKTAEKIKILRLQKGMTQEELGKAVGVQRAAINKYEKGSVVNIKRSVLQKLADSLGVAPVDLLDDDEIASAESDKEKRMLFYMRRLSEEQTDMLIKVAKSLVEE